MSYKENYGRFNANGDVESAEAHRSVALTLGVGMRLHPDWQIQTQVPLISQTQSYGGALLNRAGLGDVSLGGEWTAVEALFTDDWYPTIRIQGGLKVPSGSVESKQNGAFRPGTGNGMWEPYVGVGLEKRFGAVSLGVRGSFTARAGGRERLGNQIELSEVLSYGFSPRFAVAVGSSQTWNGDTFANGRVIPGTRGNSISAFLQPTYFLDRAWSVAVSADFTVPQYGWSRNVPASQAVTAVTRYGFF